MCVIVSTSVVILAAFAGAVSISVTGTCYVGKSIQISRISVWFLHARIHNVHVCTSSQ